MAAWYPKRAALQVGPRKTAAASGTAASTLVENRALTAISAAVAHASTRMSRGRRSHFWMTGAAKAPRNPPRPKIILARPTRNAEVPERCKETTIAKIMPVKAMLSGAAIISRARRNGLPSTNRRPSSPAAPPDVGGSLRGCCRGRRMTRTATSDSRWLSALPRNGSDLPSPNSSPPIGGPASEVP